MDTAIMHCCYQPSQEEKNIYYILTENYQYGRKLFHAGSMCYVKEKTYLQHISGISSCFWMFVMEEDGTEVTMDVESLQPVNERMAEFLLAIQNVQERLNCFLDRQVLDVAMKAKLGQKVLVELDHQTFPGTICYIGKLHKSYLLSGLFPIYFGVELQGDGEGRGHCAGTYDKIEYFKCKQKCGVFLPFNKLQFLLVSENDQVEQKAEQKAEGAVPVKMGDTVGFYLDDAFTRGIVMEVYKKGSDWIVKVCPEEEGSADVFREIPIDAVVREEMFSPVFDTDVDSGLREYLRHERRESVEDLEGKPCSLGVNSVVRINLDQEITVTGMIRWIGCLPPTQQRMAGVELDEEKGFSDGEWQGVRYFTCLPRRGVFVRLELCHPDLSLQGHGGPFLESPALSDPDAPAVLSNSPPLREDLAVTVLQGRMRGIQGHCNSCYMDAALFRLAALQSSPPRAGGGSALEEPVGNSWTRTLRAAWILVLGGADHPSGFLNFLGLPATFASQQYFAEKTHCRLLFCGLSDRRTLLLLLASVSLWSLPKSTPPSPDALVLTQWSDGHLLSRHSLFACTSVLDSMLYKPPLAADGHIQETLRDKIVNPLRQKGFVAAKNMMDLRFQLTEKGESSSFATSEKDPEEFLNLIMHRVLGLEPLLKLQSGQLKEQECYCYQIFMDKQEDLVVPNVQQLVEHSFISSDLKLVEIPSCFILQMPRFGKEYKMFSKIIPSLELDITDLLLNSPRECFVCGDVATQECSACFKDKMFANTGIKQFCDSCCRQAHAHYQRKSHQTTKLHVPKEFCRDSHHDGVQVPREKLELFAVLCIETSHYVSFVKYGPERENWMFFDSMADRHGDENGYNIPTVTLCPEVAKYLKMPVAALAMQQPRDMEGVAKRLFCDAYMYMFQSKKMALYK